MSFVFGVLAFLLWLFLMFMIGRLVLDVVQMFSRAWRPRGVMLVVAEAVYTVTDPPMRAVRRVIPPLRIGQISLDLAFLLIFIVVQVLIMILDGLAARSA